MEHRTSPAFLKKVKEFKENPPGNPYERMAIKYLYNRLETYVRVVQAKNQDKKKAKAELYRNLVRYMMIVQSYIDKYEEELLDLLDEGEDIYFPSDNEHLKKINNNVEINLMEPHNIKKWIKAWKQEGNKDE